MSTPVTDHPHHDPSRSDRERLEALVAALTGEERLGLLHQYQAPVPRLGLAGFRTGTEALHGLAWLGTATVFPQALGLAATWDPDLVRRVGAAVADEVLAARDRGAGRNVWAPVVNPLRDPRWGRNEEGWSEDPWLTGLLATAYARGLAGDGPRLRTAPTLKHFLGYNNETDRCTTSSGLPPRVLHEYELPAFLPALREGAAVAVMPSYNLVNGRPAHLSPLIDEVLRTAAPDELLLVSDAMAPGNLFDLQVFHPDGPTAYAHALRAGLDSFTQDDDRPEATLEHLREALRRGLLTEADVERAVRHALSVRLRLGEFDPDPVPEGALDTPEHRALARESAARSLVLLRNEDRLLPLRDVRRVAVIGPLSDTVLTDWYSGTPPYTVTARGGIAERVEVVHHEGVDRIRLSSLVMSVVEPEERGPLRLGKGDGDAFAVLDWGGGALTLRSDRTGLHLDEAPDGTLACTAPGPGTWEVRQTFRLEEVTQAGGSEGPYHLVQIHTGRYVGVRGDGTLSLVEDAGDACPFWIDRVSSGSLEAARLAATADVAVVVVGDHPMVNGRETEDRADLELPAAQRNLIRMVRSANPATVLVVSSGYPFAITWAAEHVPAILWSAHGGQEYGRALADVLFGDTEPVGRLTQTWYRSAGDLPDLLDYDIIGSGGTYLYFEGEPLYPFGHGLGYAEPLYGDPEVTVTGDRVTVTVPVTNPGDRPLEEVVQIYTRQTASRVRVPLKALRGFARLRLEPGETATAEVDFAVADLARWDTVDDRPIVEDAPREVLVGRSAADIRGTAPLDVPGEPPAVRRGTWSAAGYEETRGTALCPLTPERGDAVRAVDEGAWIRFRDVDLGTGVTGCRVLANADRPAVLRAVLDDPYSGPTLAVLRVPKGEDPYDFAEVEADALVAVGVRDLYLVCDTPGAAVAAVTLTG
ncbi:glycoside hydrolase family 3 C-terminal domain-containing protein [Nocardiopsis lambiniae]|uniref:Glycoside hydrolase family 3 C-terminal domain-containing protein n=1 Tax=Nocardiopsis lambiniae TaxID=3075539 RepID=A0ABU2M6G6_9ACTN|nr:glycoside hydrolase family 3 C-terminal domain-containing protein [Nocardiopsis sp. DSM 44743]MDT0328168.1 glycoside hydrolase family 3 C-terminal domain-containing protein [Nocardiopsis sp. DSM 44743]